MVHMVPQHAPRGRRINRNMDRGPIVTTRPNITAIYQTRLRFMWADWSILHDSRRTTMGPLGVGHDRPNRWTSRIAVGLECIRI